jgi:hypothetical protein
MQVLSFIFLQISSSGQGYILEPREMWYPSWVIYAVILSIGMVGLVRVLNQDLIYGVFACLFVRPTSSTNFRETMSLLGKTFWLMLFNYFIISTVLVFMFLQLTENTYSIYITLIPIAMFLHPIFALVFMSLFTGEYRRLRENIQIVSMTHQLIGLILIPLTIVLLLNPSYLVEVLYVGVVIYLLFLAVRLFRGTSYAIQNKIPWYYIILYLCSLEILPLGIFYKLLA